MIKEKEIKTEKPGCCQDVFTKGKHHHHHCSCHNHSSAIYSLGVIGALFYFLQNAATFSAVILGIFKSIFWPAFVLFRVLTELHL